MTQPTSRITEAQTQSPNKARVEVELKTLQDANRLAIHIHERSPEATRGFLAKNDAIGMQDIHQRIEDSKLRGIAVLSMSLIPDTASGATIKPYNTPPSSIRSSGYLFALDDNGAPQAPRILGVNEDGLSSGCNPYDKSGMDSQLRMDNGRFLAQQRLDGLGAHYHENECRGNAAIPYNEVLVAACAQHMKAIVIPVHQDYPPKPWQKAALQLQGALEGLEHLENGIDLPVVLYHVNGQHQGQVTYLAQGKAELVNKSLEALNQRSAMRVSDLEEVVHLNRTFTERTQRLLGIDFSKSMTQQQEVITRLRQECGLNNTSRVVR